MRVNNVVIKIATFIVLTSFLFPVLLTGAAITDPVAVEALTTYIPVTESSAKEIIEPEIVPEPDFSVYIPDAGMTPEQTLEAYFEQQYLAYTSLSYIDISAIIDTSLSRMRNSLVWLELLIQRRRLLDENNLCYVDTRMLPYEIIYLDEADIEDNRVEFWQTSNITYDGEVMLHFTIKGVEGEAYPPMLAVNSQQTVRMRLEGDVWKISFHYYPGSVRKYRWLDPLNKPSDGEALNALIEEFTAYPQMESPTPPVSVSVYNGSLAAEYALLHAETPNPDFYHIGDWMGNCANFTSQCMWYGFGDGTQSLSSGENMTNRWFAGGGGGSPAWENVDYFWDYATTGSEFTSLELSGVSQLQPGDLIQTRAKDMADDNGFSHSLIVADADKMLLAQNSPGNFVYYSDLVNVEARYLRPLWVLG